MNMTFPFRTLSLLGTAAAVLAACANPGPDYGGRVAYTGNAACMAAAKSAAFHSQGGRSGAPASRAVALSCGTAKDAPTLTAAKARAAFDPGP